jgi:hypothetical protein
VQEDGRRSRAGGRGVGGGGGQTWAWARATVVGETESARGTAAILARGCGMRANRRGKKPKEPVEKTSSRGWEQMARSSLGYGRYGIIFHTQSTKYKYYIYIYKSCIRFGFFGLI